MGLGGITKNSKLGRKNTKYSLLEMRKENGMSGKGDVYRNKKLRLKDQFHSV